MAGMVELDAAGLAGALLFCAGAAWVAWAASLHRAAGHALAGWGGGGSPGGGAPVVLLDEGPYRLGRHPMYLGTLVMLIGLALGLAQPVLAALALLLAVRMHRVWIPREEAQLAARFGGWWRDYAATVRRWI